MISIFFQYLPAIVLIIIFATQLWRRAFLAKRIRYFFWLPVGIVFAMVAYQSINQYFSWLNAGSPTSALLPPATPITYFLFYILTRFWLPYLLALAFGGIAYLAAKYLNKKYEERFFYPEEYYLIALGFFLSVHPFWLGFLIIAALGYLGYTLITALRQGSEGRASFYYLWLPAALLIALLTPWLKTLSFLTVLKV